ncbi:Imm51 family immunity protein [Kineosporia babensis]|uniref:Immunity 51 family protein n=1 Tax=Kineosporia babensis TaxID=499548 RepID=A0A9X1NMW3_9ACTN|nr:Imm51 family immunity protein [Kineosporia babensis]MCD5317108.1 immunity 51 family protein [Kineosporia babensis]
MKPLKLLETTPGKYSLIMSTGGLPTDEAVSRSGHEPNGYFWDGVAEWVIRNQVPEVKGRVNSDSEAGMYCAYGTDREALATLGEAMARVANAPDTLLALITEAKNAGIEFDD